MTFLESLKVQFEESSFLARTTVFILLSALTGSGLLYVITEYAIYFYLLTHGVRPAFEGVSFISATVAFFGLCFSIATSLIYIVVRYLIFKVVDVLFGSAQAYAGIFGIALSETPYGVRYELMYKKVADSVKSVRLVSFSSICIFFAVCSVVVWLFFWLTEASLSPEGKMGFSILSALFVLSALTIWRGNISWYIGGVSAAASFIYLVIIVSDFENLKTQLRVLQYGGGINIEATYSGTNIKHEMKLLLRTNTSLIGERNETGEFEEILLNAVSKIRYLKNQNLSEQPPL